MKRYTQFDCPLGLVTLQFNEQGILGLWFETQTTQPEQLGVRCDRSKLISEVKKQLEEYFAGRRENFDLPLAAKGTEFQNCVWRALEKIPYGKTICYQELANLIGNPNAVRAVGLANGKNPISIIVPCHRVIGKNGKLTGYAGGVERKAHLLKLEGAME